MRVSKEEKQAIVDSIVRNAMYGNDKDLQEVLNATTNTNPFVETVAVDFSKKSDVKLVIDHICTVADEENEYLGPDASFLPIVNKTLTKILEAQEQIRRAILNA